MASFAPGLRTLLTKRAPCVAADAAGFFISRLRYSKPLSLMAGRSPCGPAAVDGEHGAGDVGCGVRGQNHRGAGGLVRRADATERRFRGETRREFLVLALKLVARKRAGRDGVDADRFRAPMAGHIARELKQRRLR